jgi:hypothetical protein
MPRVGSTLIEQILAAHPRVHGAGEIDEMVRRVKELPGEVSTSLPFPDLVAVLDGPALDRLAARHLEVLRGMDESAERIVDKNLQNFRLCGLIALMLPKARVINVRRDPMATCLSSCSRCTTRISCVTRRRSVAVSSSSRACRGTTRACDSTTPDARWRRRATTRYGSPCTPRRCGAMIHSARTWHRSGKRSPSMAMEDRDESP